MHRLPFQMPPFRSLAWVSDEARSVWETRFRQISLTTVHTAVMGVETGKWDHRSLHVHGWLYLKCLSLKKKHGIQVNATPVGDPKAKGPVFYEVQISRDQTKPVLPPCCEHSSGLSSETPQKEFLWEAAIAAGPDTPEPHILELRGTTVMGAFWQQVLTHPVAHRPCSLQCPDSLALQESHLQFMETLGFAQEADWLRELYTWPVEWSVSHGIAEVRTPVIKVSYDTDATAMLYRVRVYGTDYPKEGQRGLNFPYQRKSFLKISDSKSFKKGLEHGMKSNN